MNMKRCLKVFLLVFLLWNMACANTALGEGRAGAKTTETSQSTPVTMPLKLIAISSGHTGCLPADITNHQILMSQTGWGSEWFYVWQFQCHHKKFVCSLYWIGVEGTGVDAHCSEMLSDETPPPQ
tara:strand:+ start:115 stop:489 length:375 start_codon:yes stop_codon:yes gene_type:complete